MTATELANWFALRDHPDADPTIQALAREMRWTLASSTPEVLKPGEWHLPFVTLDERSLPLEDQKKLSAARCAATSYNNVGTDTRLGVDAAYRIWGKLIDSQPMHASPVEHQCTPGEPGVFSGNLRGWVQLRKTLPNEAIHG